MIATVAVFLLTWVLIASRRLSWLPIGRPAGALLGAVGMVAVGALSPAEALDAVDEGTIALLLGMMLITAWLERSGWFAWATHRALTVARTPRQLLVAVCVSAGLLSALLVNDTVCLFMTPLLVALLRRTGLPPAPYLVALATSANLGSAATLVGNPQNMLIGSMSGISFASFLGTVGPVAAVALAAHVGLLSLLFRRELSAHALPDPGPPPALASDAPLVLLVGAAVTMAMLGGLHLGFSALGGAVALMVLDRREPSEAFARVDWSLLLFFAGLFVVVRGLAATGLPERAWDLVAPNVSLSEPAGAAALTGALVVGSNVVSNVPLVLLVGPKMASLGPAAWPLLGLVATVAGNLTLVGSVANVIVAEQAKEVHDLGFWEYARVGVPATALSLLVGVPLLLWRGYS
ncbi:MAG: anion transporter [Alphaproteobacteria bacterium]|nr:anion transporter [Alphaproteobacteria bacterium]